MLAVSLLVALSLNQVPATDQAGRITGRVTVAGANTPVSGARVILLPTARPTGPMGPPPQAITDQDGRYTFEKVAPGTYRLDAQRTGFAPLSAPARPRAVGTVEVAAGQSIAVNLELQRGAVIAGRVLDPRGEPLTDARIMVLRRVPAPATTGMPSRLMPAPGQGQQTNDLGEFRVSGLPPGEYYVAAIPRPAMMFGGPRASTTPVPQGPRTTTATTYYPGTSDQAAAQPIAVAAGAEVGNINFAVQTAPAFRVSGTVVDENGNPVAGAMVMLMGDPRSGAMLMGPSGNGQSRDNGRFDIDEVPAGTYRANASVPMRMTGSAGAGSGGVGSWTSSSVGSGGVTTSSWSSVGGAEIAGTMQQPVEVVVTDADVTGVRVVIRRPVRQ